MAQQDHRQLVHTSNDVESSEEMTFNDVQVQRFGPLKKAALAAAVGALVVVGANHIQPSGSLSQAHTGVGGEGWTSITNQAEIAAKSAVVGKVMGDWGKGLYHGAACKETAETTFTNDVVVDASGGDMKNTDIYKKYYGIDGLCNWFAHQEQVSFKGFKIRSVLPSGYGEDGEDREGGQDDVILQIINTPTIGKEADYPMKDMSRWTVKDGKVSAVEFYLGDSLAMDTLFAKYDAKAIVEKVIGDWGMGHYDGVACEGTAEHGVARDCEGRHCEGSWAHDVVVDASGMDMKNTDIYKKYYGIDGLCKWFANQEQISFKDFRIESMLPSGGNDLTLHVSNTPTVKATGKEAAHPMQDLWRWTIKDGKISAIKFYFGDAVAMDALFARYDSKAIVQKVMGDWGMGLYHGEACKETAKKGKWSKDLVFDASGMNMKNTDIYKKYYGIDGLCQWFASQEQISFKGFRIESIVLSGRDDVVVQVSNTPTVKATGLEADYSMRDMSRWTILDGKIIATKFYLGDAVAMDALFAKDHSKAIVQKGLEADLGTDGLSGPESVYGKYD